MTVTSDRDIAGKGSNVFAEIWKSFRPYFVRFGVDFLIAAVLWITLYLFKVLTTWLAVDGWAADFIHGAHSVGVVSAAVVFAILFVLDIYTLHRSRK